MSEVEGAGHGRLYRTASLDGVPAWDEVFRTAQGTSWGNILGEMGGHLYISVPATDGLLVYRSASGDPGTWEIASLPGLKPDPANKSVLADGAAGYNSALYLGVVNWQTNFTIWRSTGERFNNTQIEKWDLIPATGIDDAHNIFVQLVTFNDALYAWTSNPKNGQQVWRIVCRHKDQ